MDGIAIKAMVSELAPVVREYVEAAQAPLLERIAALESEKSALSSRCEVLEQAATKSPDIDLISIEKMIEAELAKLPAAEPAKEVDMEQVAALVNEAVSALPPAEPGKDGQDGKSLTLDDVAPMISEAVERAVEALPKPENGKDAANIVEAVKHEGELCLTLQDGRLIRTGIRDGEKGTDGRDGFSLEDFDCEPVDERTIKLMFTRGDTTHSFELEFPLPIYRDIYKEGTQYARGDLVTWGGCLWHADKATTGKPDGGDWTMAVKKGRDGRDYQPKDAKPNG